MNWQGFEEAANELAMLGRGRFENSGMAMLGTIRADGSPRISPCEVFIVDGELLLGMMWQSKKALDLVRDPRVAVHSTTCDRAGTEGDFKLYGRVVDVAFGGAFYASLQERVEPRELPRLIELGRRVKADLEAAHDVVHPLEPELRDVYGVIFWQHEADEPFTQRNVTVFADGEVDRSPCGSGTSARLALLHAGGALATGDELRHLSIVGSEFTGRVVAETEVAGRSAVVTEVEDVVLGSVLRSIVVLLPRIPSSFLMVVVVS